MTAFVDPRRSSRRPVTGVRLMKVLRDAGNVVRAILLWPARVHANRQLMARMGGMSDHELSDVGLSRSDLMDSAALPLDSEIGSFLARRAYGRRQLRP